MKYQFKHVTTRDLTHETIGEIKEKVYITVTLFQYNLYLWINYTSIKHIKDFLYIKLLFAYLYQMFHHIGFLLDQITPYMQIRSENPSSSDHITLKKSILYDQNLIC